MKLTGLIPNITYGSPITAMSDPLGQSEQTLGIFDLIKKQTKIWGLIIYFILLFFSGDSTPGDTQVLFCLYIQASFLAVLR